jgi:hypothetical protein
MARIILNALEAGANGFLGSFKDLGETAVMIK